jgi:hypothetical protein
MGLPPVVVTVEWEVPAPQACPVATALQSLMLATRRQPGCLGCSLDTDMHERVTLRYRERWSTEADLARRLIVSATSPPRVEFALAAGTTRGFEYARELRQEPQHISTWQ